MIRQHLPQSLAGERHFRWRGGDVSRVEGLSDAVFAFALTLLVVSLEVPRSFDELREAMRSFPAFGACFAFLLWCWYLHYRYHRRYGFEDAVTVTLNGLLLFVILFYVYPLKFLADVLFQSWFGSGTDGGVQLEAGDYRSLMVFYSTGFVGIFALFLSMSVRAYLRRDALDLDPGERYQTRAEIAEHLLSAGIGLLSLALALLGGGWLKWSGLVFFMMGPAHGLRGYLTGRGLDRVLASSAARAPQR